MIVKGLCTVCGEMGVLVVSPSSRQNKRGNHNYDRDGVCPACARKMASSMGEFISIARQEAGLTQYNITELTGISWRHLSPVENGQRGCTIETIIKIADACGCSIDHLIGHDVKSKGVKTNC